MIMATMEFTGREVLQAYTGILLCDLGRLYALLSHAVGEEVYTHQIPRVQDEVKPWLERWFPEMAEAGSGESQLRLSERLRKLKDGVDRKPAIDAWFSEAAKLAGIKPRYEVPQIPMDDHDRIDPVTEAQAMGFAKVVVVDRPER